ncbi:MAG TPA: hypothetical protein P5161_01445 [Eubacteriales bacterium]|jgi:hypothetical protein|nr:hypothetical protein [Clostridia bacterium]HRR89432.1 hypothetical protein [Eubacteriales bacterium]HRU84639.1 hypothetical protein [Eubacteriales bacterium]
MQADFVLTKEKSREFSRSRAFDLALIGVCSAILTAGKLVLSFVPNVEVVTLFILVFSSALGTRRTFLITLCFCVTETIIYGFGTWVPAYFIHWNLLGLSGALLLRRCGAVRAVALAALFTVAFGGLTSLIDVLFAAAGGVESSQLFRLFELYYVRGIWFYGTHFVSNVIITAVLFFPLSAALKTILFRTEPREI